MLFEEDAIYYAEKVKAKELTVSQLVEAAIENIEEYNLVLQAVTHLQAEEARQQAKVMDEKIGTMSKEALKKLPVFFWCTDFTQGFRTRRS